MNPLAWLEKLLNDGQFSFWLKIAPPNGVFADVDLRSISDSWIEVSEINKDEYIWVNTAHLASIKVMT